MGNPQKQRAVKLAPLRLKGEELEFARSETTRILKSGGQGRDAVAQEWGNLANRLKIPSEFRSNVMMLREAIFTLIAISLYYQAREELCQRLGVSEIKIGMSVTVNDQEAFVTGLSPDGQVHTEYREKVPAGRKQRKLTNPVNIFPSRR